MFKPYFFLDLLVLYEATFLVQTNSPALKPTFHKLTRLGNHFFPEYDITSQLLKVDGRKVFLLHSFFSVEWCTGFDLIRQHSLHTLGEYILIFDFKVTVFFLYKYPIIYRLLKFSSFPSGCTGVLYRLSPTAMRVVNRISRDPTANRLIT